MLCSISGTYKDGTIELNELLPQYSRKSGNSYILGFAN